jgi:hypothetical protein
LHGFYFNYSFQIQLAIQEPSTQASNPPEEIYNIIQDSDKENAKSSSRLLKSKADRKIAP